MKTIAVNELKDNIDVYDILDVRETDEFFLGHVPNAVNLPLSTLSYIDLEMNLDKHKVYYVICQSGNRSIQVCNYLEQHGYETVNVDGGTSAFEREFELVR